MTLVTAILAKAGADREIGDATQAAPDRAGHGAARFINRIIKGEGGGVGGVGKHAAFGAGFHQGFPRQRVGFGEGKGVYGG